MILRVGYNEWEHIGILGGTFDPPHYGHLRLAEITLAQIGCSRVVVRPSFGNLFKSACKTPFVQRMKMCTLFFNSLPGVTVDDGEIAMPYPTYSYRTVQAMFDAEPAYYHFIIGEDCMKDLPKWQSLSEMFSYADIYCVGPNVIEKHRNLPARIRRNAGAVECDMPYSHSTEIREQIAQGIYDPTKTSSDVLDYIKEKRLYQE